MITAAAVILAATFAALWLRERAICACYRQSAALYRVSYDDLRDTVARRQKALAELANQPKQL